MMFVAIAAVGFLGLQVAAGSQAPATRTPPAPRPAPLWVQTGVAPPADYVIGPDDQLSVLFWRDKDMSSDVVVRTDGRISLPLLNDVQAAGLTPDQLRQKVIEEAKRFLEDPNATIVIRQIHSRKVFITGQVEKPGPYALLAPTTVLQLIAMAGGLREYADGQKIMIFRTEKGVPVSYKFNYKWVMKRKNLRQNVELKPGD